MISENDLWEYYREELKKNVTEESKDIWSRKQIKDAIPLKKYKTMTALNLAEKIHRKDTAYFYMDQSRVNRVNSLNKAGRSLRRGTSINTDNDSRIIKQ